MIASGVVLYLKGIEASHDVEGRIEAMNHLRSVSRGAPLMAQTTDPLQKLAIFGAVLDLLATLRDDFGIDFSKPK